MHIDERRMIFCCEIFDAKNLPFSFEESIIHIYDAYHY